MKTYTFRGMGADGTFFSVDFVARNMRVAVAKFANTRAADPDFPKAMSWSVKLQGSKTSHPVTRERWGHAFDGRV